MPRQPRIRTQPNAGVEVMNRVVLAMHLTKPSAELNLRIVGALARARERHSIEIFSGAFASSHFHLYFRAATVQDESNFMRDFTRKFSIESGHEHDWKAPTFTQRYHGAEVSEEPEVQIQRLTYHLSHGPKENLCDSPLDWPGVPFAEALISGEPLEGVWIDRTGFRRARDRGEDVTLDDFREPMELPLAPLPCWQHLDHGARRQKVLEIVRQIEEETAARHAAKGTTPLGSEFVRDGDPYYRPPTLKKSSQPKFHAAREKARDQMRVAFSMILGAYLEASERLRAGDRGVIFPENTFPPGLPFVCPVWASSISPRALWEPG